jgi:hypothetical protein
VAVFVAFCGGEDSLRMPNSINSFRIGRGRTYRRSRVWYLYYFENGAAESEHLVRRTPTSKRVKKTPPNLRN